MLANIRPLLKFFTVLSILPVLHGCATHKNYSYRPQTMEINLSEPLTGSSSDYLKAAEDSTTLNQTAKADYLLSAAVKLIDEHAIDRAEQIIQSIPDQDLNFELMNHKYLLKAHLDLMKGYNQRALNALSRVQPKYLPDHYRIQFHFLLAHVYENQKHALPAVEQRIKLASLLSDPKELQTNKERLWTILLQMKPAELRMTKLEAPQNTVLSGWLELALIAHDAGTSGNWSADLKAWHEANPNHPGSDLLDSTVADTKPIKQVALLIPSSGALAKPAQAIREGFMAARFSDRRNVNVRIYNTDKQDVGALYQKAVADGNQIVIGPLSKDKVRQLTSDYDGRVPVLTLNYSDTDRKRGSLYEFGLSPIDEVQQVAATGWQKGYRNVLVIAPEGNWGQFIAHNFEDIWTSFGGNVLNKWYFKEGDRYNDKVKELLNLNHSYSRIWFAKSVTQNYKIKTIPRRRQDIDMIFVLAYPTQIRQILPLLRFYYANDVDIMSISTGYIPGAPTRINRDLNGVYFCDMPWVFANDDARYYQLSRRWPEQYNQYVRLYALGYDAYQLSEAIPKLPLLPSYALNGHSGYLRIDETNHVRRKLQWAQVKNGRAQKI